jgi:hypothetical protein
MLSKPLACPSALDRRLGVLRGGDLEPGALAASEKRRQKQPVIQRRIQPARSAEGPFSLRRGLKSERIFLKLGITPWRIDGLGSKTTKATLSDRLRSSCYAARNLARTPPSEDGDRTGRAPAAEQVRCVRQPSGVGRFGLEHRDGV